MRYLVQRMAPRRGATRSTMRPTTRKQRSRERGLQAPQGDVPVVTTDGGQSYADVDGVNAQASQAEASLERAAVGDGRIARSVDGLCWGAMSTRRRRDARCDPYFGRRCATWTRSPMHTESGEFCSKVVAAEALGHDKGDLGTAHVHGHEMPTSQWVRGTDLEQFVRISLF